VSDFREIKLRIKDPESGKMFMFPALMAVEGKRLAFCFDWCPPLQAEIKSMQGARWEGYDKKNPRKVWTVENSQRNKFRLDALRYAGKNPDGTPVIPGTYDPYARWSTPLVDFNPTDRPYYGHQPHGIRFVITRRQCMLGWDMGTGKTLTIIRSMEWAKDEYGWADEDFWFVCKGGAMFQVQLDYVEWKSRVRPKFLSYEQLVSLVNSWPKGKPAPKFVVFDESSMIKNPSAQRTTCAQHLADAMRAEHGPEVFIVCMTGTPSPKNPVDWWSQVEVIAPGFLKEGDHHKFRRSLAIIEKVDKEDGGSFPKLITWLDDARKCSKCGEFAQAAVHGDERIMHGNGHYWKASVNEVERIYVRLKGLVDIKFKKDCLDLPKKVRRIIRCKPSAQVLNAAKLVTKAAPGAAQALILLRELSDGFQYQELPTGTKKCPTCGGTGSMLQKYDPESETGVPTDQAIREGKLAERIADCDRCSGLGEVDVLERKTVRMACPKDDVLEDIIADHEDVGRLVVYAGFTGSVDRVVDVFLKNKWSVIRVDARGWVTFTANGQPQMPLDGRKAYEAFRYGQKEFEKVGFVAQASTAGHGLNFDCCPTEVFYSNDFNWENRTQAGERAMRGKIAQTLAKHGRQHVLEIDIVHLPSDQFVLDNHEKKRKLQALTMGEVQAAMESSIASAEEFYAAVDGPQKPALQ
jgi:hypothetical protein